MSARRAFPVDAPAASEAGGRSLSIAPAPGSGGRRRERVARGIIRGDSPRYRRPLLVKTPTGQGRPELNPIEHVWDALREKSFHNRAFASMDAFEDQLRIGLLALENDWTTVKSIVAWGWIVNALLK